MHRLQRYRVWLALALVGGVSAATVLAACGTSRDSAPTPTPGVAESNQFRAPASFDSYRFRLSIEASTDLMDLTEVPAGLNVDGSVLTIEIEGARVNPDREYSISHSSFGPLALDRETIVIGDVMWSRQAGGAWQQRAVLAGPEDLVGQDVLLSPAVVFGDDPEMLERVTRDLQSRPATPAIIHGRPVRHWILDGDWLRSYRSDFHSIVPAVAWPEQMEIHIWADVEWRIATKLLVLAATPTNPEALRFELNIFDVDNPDIAVDIPEGAIGR